MSNTAYTPVKIGMVSFAHMHAASYASALNALPGVTICGITDNDPIRGKAMAERFGTSFFETVDALLNEGPDGVIICSENSLHRLLVEQCAGRTGSILCEKPIATTPEDAQAMIDCCAETGTKLQIAFPVRFSPVIQQLKKTLDADQFGRIYAAKCTNHGTMPGGWFIDQELAGGGAVIDHTVHVIDLLRWFWGTEVTEVYAEVGEDLLHSGMNIDDAGMLSFTLANGIYGTLDTSWSRPDSYPTWGDVKIEILGQHGGVHVDAFEQNISVSSDVAGKTQWVNWGSNMDEGLVLNFVTMIRQEGEPFITGEDGLRALEVALAAYESARTGQPVALR